MARNNIDENVLSMRHDSALPPSTAVYQIGDASPRWDQSNLIVGVCAWTLLSLAVEVDIDGTAEQLGALLISKAIWLLCGWGALNHRAIAIATFAIMCTASCSVIVVTLTDQFPESTIFFVTSVVGCIWKVAFVVFYLMNQVKFLQHRFKAIR